MGKAAELGIGLLAVVDKGYLAVEGIEHLSVEGIEHLAVVDKAVLGIECLADLDCSFEDMLVLEDNTLLVEQSIQLDW